jgi:hypothetical protein
MLGAAVDEAMADRGGWRKVELLEKETLRTAELPRLDLRRLTASQRASLNGEERVAASA